MSTATAEPPVAPSTAATTAAELPDLSGAFADAMKGLEAKETPTPQGEKPTVKAPETKAPDAKVEKSPAVTETKKPKSALDAALSDDAPTEVVAEPVDEVAELIKSEEPNKDNWKKTREVLKQQSTKLKEYEAKLAKPELPADVAVQLSQAKEMKAQMEQLKAENAKMKDNILALDVRFDPSVQEKIAARDNGVAKLAATLKDAGADSAAFEEAMAMPLAKRGKYLDAILEGIESARTRATVERKLAEIEVTDEQLDEQLSKPHKSFEELKQQRVLAEQQHMEKVEQFKQATFEKVQRELPKLSKLMRMAPADSEGAKEYNETLQSDLAKAPSLLEVEPEQAAQAAYMAARYPTVEKLYIESRSKIAELEAYVAKLEGADPGFRGNGKTQPKADYDIPLADAFAQAMNAQKGI